MCTDLGLSADLLRPSEYILDGKLDEKIYLIYGVLLNENNRLYGTKNCLNNHCDIWFSFLRCNFHNFVTLLTNETPFNY